MKQIDVLATVLVIVGALNWGLVAVAGFDLVAAVFGMSFGEVSMMSAFVYGLVGLSGLYLALSALRMSRAVAVAALGAATVTLAGANPAVAQSKDIVDTAVAAGSFNTLATALKAADLVETLKGQGPFTVFAPTDAAFAKLPAGTLESLLKPENKAQLRRILTYHVVPGKVMASDVVTLRSAAAVSGDTIAVAVSGAQVRVDNANVVKTDIVASNGVIHVIDAVILPGEDR
jgi:uncharacterized surface protein with fasciclin (FAS1) repeats